MLSEQGTQVQCRAPTIIIVMSSPTGHINASLGLADRLRSAGYSVAYLGGPSVGTVVRRQGFGFYAAPFLDALPVPFGIRHRPTLPNGGVKEWLRGARSEVIQARREVRELLQSLPDLTTRVDDLVYAIRPSLLLFDPFVLLFYILFYRHRIPTAVLSTKPLLDPDRLVPPYTVPLIPDGSPSSVFSTRVAWLRCGVKYRLWELYERLMSGFSLRGLTEVLAQQVGFPFASEWATRPVLFDMKFRSLPELVLHARELDFQRSRLLPRRTLYVGPNVHTRRTEDAFTWEGITLRDKLILCAFGTAVHSSSLPRRRRFLQELVLAMAGRPRYTLILALGPALHCETSSRVPDNVHLFQTVPQLEILQYADLFITHGGSNSVKEAVATGVPMLVYPDRGEQPGWSARVVYRGMGERGSLVRAKARDITQLMDRVLTDKRYHAAVLEAQRIARAYDERGVAIDVVRQLIGCARPRDDRSAVDWGPGVPGW